MLSITPNAIPVAKLHAYLLSAVAPRPIALASTIAANGTPNLAPFSFFNVFSANPPIVIFSPARRVRNNTIKHTLENVQNVPEVVINVVNYAIVQQTSLSSTDYPEGVNEFDKAGFTMLASDVVQPFRVAESPIQLECKVNQILPLGTSGGAGNVVLCEVVKLHIDEAVLDAENQINQEKLDLVSRAGGSYYSRAKEGFFSIPKPIRNLGIGVDSLPENIKNSTILTGNNLGLLANVEALPTAEEIALWKKQNKEVVEDLKNNEEKKHKKAIEYLDNNKVSDAWNVLLS